jgi:carbamoyltransferase
MNNYILGISCYYHDAAAAILRDGEIIAAAQEERFTRVKNDLSFPVNAINFCLKECGINLSDVDEVIFYEDPILKFKRVYKTALRNFPASLFLWVRVIPAWLTKKIYWKSNLQKEFQSAFQVKIESYKFKSIPHHRSHAASAYFPSPYQEAAVLVVDGVGEIETVSIWHAKDNKLSLVHKIEFPHSLGLLYSAFTYYTGFKVNSGEYKVMGLAPYGLPKFKDLILEKLLSSYKDGKLKLDKKYFSFEVSKKLISPAFELLFGSPSRKRESGITQREMDLAASIQYVTNLIMLDFAKKAQDLTGSKNLCMAGGVALNCVANGEIQRSKIFQNIWIQPAAGDAGGALGCALSHFYEIKNNALIRNPALSDSMKGSLLGPSYTNEEVRTFLDSVGAVYEYIPNNLDYCKRIATLISQGSVIGWHQGRMEFGPRALGARSILGDPQNSTMQSVMNLKIKFRESFRPFAPSVLLEYSQEYFDHAGVSPYMLIVAPVREEIRLNQDINITTSGIDRLGIIRSSIPAVTHLDYSARIQTVDKSVNEKYWTLISEFNKITGCPVLINSSFNVRGEPIVCSPGESYRCFMRTGMDVLAIEGFVLLKPQQPKYVDNFAWESEFELD